MGRNYNTCSYAIKSHDQNYCITLCILINVIETLKLKPITINSTHYYIKGQYSERQVRESFKMPEVLHTVCNMCSRDLPDMSALTLGLVHTYQENPSCTCYIYNIYNVYIVVV